MTKRTLRPIQRFSSAKSSVFVATAVVVGVVIILVTLAAGAAGFFEPENGTLTGGAKVVTVAGASGGKAVQFSPNPATPTPTPTTTPTPPPTPTPSSSGTCAPYPSFPNAACTGPTGTLTTYTGSLTFSTPGQVIQNVIINTSDGVTVTANNVTFRNCKINYTGTTTINALVEANAPTGTVFDHCELYGKQLAKDAIHGGDNFTVTGCNIHDTGNGVEAGSAFTVKESYIWNIVSPAGFGWHADGVQAWDGASNMLVDHNTILMPAGEDGTVDFVGASPQSNNLVQHNLLAGGGYSVSVGSSAGNTNVRVINNHLSTRYFPKVGYYDIYYYGDGEAPGITVSGNVIDETGAPADHNI
jgi:hypothetical protein